MDRIIGDNGLKGNKKKLKVFCSICAADSELFGDGIFETSKYHLENGENHAGVLIDTCGMKVNR